MINKHFLVLGFTLNKVRGHLYKEHIEEREIFILNSEKKKFFLMCTWLL